jgi:hypothetical protein
VPDLTAPGDEEGTVDEDERGEAGQGPEQADEQLLASLRASAARLDPVPEEALLAARSMLAHLRLDAELAELTFDSHAEGALIGLRAGTPAARHVSFDAGAAQVEFEVVEVGDRRRLIGQCVPATEATVTVHRQAEEGTGRSRVVWAETATDELGRFAVEVPAGPISLRCEWAFGAIAVETAWVRV